MKNTLEDINGRVTEEEEQITDLKNRMVDVNIMGKNLKKMKGEQSKRLMLCCAVLSCSVMFDSL